MTSAKILVYFLPPPPLPVTLTQPICTNAMFWPNLPFPPSVWTSYVNVPFVIFSEMPTVSRVGLRDLSDMFFEISVNEMTNITMYFSLFWHHTFDTGYRFTARYLGLISLERRSHRAGEQMFWLVDMVLKIIIFPKDIINYSSDNIERDITIGGSAKGIRVNGQYGHCALR